MAGEPTVTTISLVNGRPDRHSAFIGDWSGKGILRGVRFHTLAEATVPNSQDLCRWGRETLQRYIDRRTGSLTTLLTNALQSCHQELLAVNLKHRAQERVGLGLTCMALRGRDLYLCQSGPGLVYLRQDHGLRRLGPRRGEEEEQVVGLYQGEIRPYMSRVTLQEGDTLLVSFSSLLRLVTHEGIETILSSQPREGVRKFTLLGQEEPAFSAFLFHISPLRP